MSTPDLNASQAIWGVVLALHIAAMAVWTGGLAYAVFVIRPSLGLLDPTPRMNVQLQTLRRFFRLVWHVMPIVILAGWAMIVGKEGGFAHAPWFVNTMQALGLLMAAVFAWVFFGPYRRLRRAIRPSQAMVDNVRGLLVTDLALGGATIVVALLGHFPS